MITRAATAPLTCEDQLSEAAVLGLLCAAQAQPERIAAVVSAFDVKLTRADWYGIFATSQGKRLP